MEQLILVVDDEPAFCEVVCEILEAAGYRARKAVDVGQAYLILEEVIPDLILTDVMMPDVDGLTFIRELRTQSRFASVPMVVVSAKTNPDDQREAIEAGATAVLGKPFSSDHLETLVHSVLQSS